MNTVQVINIVKIITTIIEGSYACNYVNMYCTSVLCRDMFILLLGSDRTYIIHMHAHTYLLMYAHTCAHACMYIIMHT